MTEKLSAREDAWKNYREGNHPLGHKEALNFGWDAAEAMAYKRVWKWLEHQDLLVERDNVQRMLTRFLNESRK